MKISLILIASALALAILMTCVVESRLDRLLGEKISTALCWAIMLCFYLVCVGVVALVVGYFFHVSELIALAIAVPLGVPVLIVASKMA